MRISSHFQCPHAYFHIINLLLNSVFTRNKDKEEKQSEEDFDSGELKPRMGHPDFDDFK